MARRVASNRINIPKAPKSSSKGNEKLNELKENGMSSFSDVLSQKDVESIYHYIINIATSDRVVQIESGE